MKNLIVCIFAAFGSILPAQDVQLRERSNPVAKQSIFQPVSAESTDGIASIRATGSYGWNMTPVIGKQWNGEKSLVLTLEVVGSNLTPSTAVLVIDGRTFVIQSADWKVDSRGNLVAFFDKPGLVRNLASAQLATITVFAPAPVTATFQASNLAVFRSTVHIFDTDGMRLAPGEAQSPPALRMTSSATRDGKMAVKVIAQEPSATPYYWEMDGRVSVSCNWSTCAGYYTPPKSGEQQIQGAIVRLLRSDSSIVVAQCIGKVDRYRTTMMAVDAASANDANSPTVYRDCRVPPPDADADASFHGDSVKLSWRMQDGSHRQSETFDVLGVLQPVSNH